MNIKNEHNKKKEKKKESFTLRINKFRFISLFCLVIYFI
jgi:hypothetical protein